MIKVYCDRCGKDVHRPDTERIYVVGCGNINLCADCRNALIDKNEAWMREIRERAANHKGLL